MRNVCKFGLRCRGFGFIPILFFACHFASAIEPDFLMDSDPGFVAPEPVKSFNPRLKELWLEALDRPEIDMQRMAAETIARAHEFGVPDLTGAVGRLETILTSDSSHPAARFAAARALIVLDSHGSAEKLFQAAQNFGADLRQLVEPAMARWNYFPAKAVWIERIERPTKSVRDLQLAMRGLTQLDEKSVLPKLRSFAGDWIGDPDIRLEAAEAAGQISDTGLEQDAERLCSESRGSKLINRLCAIRLITRHSSEAAKRLLEQFAVDDEPTTAAAALRRLNEIDSNLVLPFTAKAIGNSDPLVRMQAVVPYLNTPTPDRVFVLVQILNDPDPSLRKRVCDGLISFSQMSEFADMIRSETAKILAGDRWQGQEQAALLLGAIVYRPAARRLVDLLESPRPEVMVASAWALRKLAVRDTLPALIDKAVRQTSARLLGSVPGVDAQVAHLFEAFGMMKAIDAKEVLAQYIPKNGLLGERSRCAAIWAAGKILEGTRYGALESALVDRINDVHSVTPELPNVRQMCVISLVRMKAVDHASEIRQYVAKAVPPTKLGLAMRWAIKELTGEQLSEPLPAIANPGRWFLEPLSVETTHGLAGK